MKHIPIHNLTNTRLTISSQCLADISELIRESSISVRILFLLSAYIDKYNSLITNLNTISKLLGKDSNKVKYGLLKLEKEGYIDLEIVELNHKHKFNKYKHNYDLYYKTNKKKWKIVKKVKYKFKIKGKYLRITVNNFVIKSNSKRKNSLLLELHNNTIFYDKDINENEVTNSYWLGEK